MADGEVKRSGNHGGESPVLADRPVARHQRRWPQQGRHVGPAGTLRRSGAGGREDRPPERQPRLQERPPIRRRAGEAAGVGDGRTTWRVGRLRRPRRRRGGTDRSSQPFSQRGERRSESPPRHVSQSRATGERRGRTTRRHQRPGSRYQQRKATLRGVPRWDRPFEAQRHADRATPLHEGHRPKLEHDPQAARALRMSCHLISGSAVEAWKRMAIYVEYSCPHCGSIAVMPLTRIERAEVALCPACHQPVRRNRAALATNWMVCCMFYAAVFLVPLSVLILLAVQGVSDFWLKLLTALCLGMIGAAAVGLPAYVYGYFFAAFRTAGSTGLDQCVIRRNGGSAVCSISGADLQGREKQAGLCHTCRRKAMA